MKVVVEGGGFLDIGDSHVAVAWDEVVRVGTASITVPLTDENLDEYGLFEDMDDMPPAGGNFRIRNLIDDYVMLGDVGYGWVEDVIFSQDGTIEAVVAEPAYGYGYAPGRYAFPYNRGYDPYGPTYATPYGVADTEEIRPLDYREFD